MELTILYFTQELAEAPEGTAGSNLEAFAATALTTFLRSKLWMYDVVPRLKRLHHVEAAVARAVEKSSGLTRNPKPNIFQTLKYL